jgi:ferredoxin
VVRAAPLTSRQRALQETKQALDPKELLNRGVPVRPALHGPLGALANGTFAPGVGFVPLDVCLGAWLGPGARRARPLRMMSGPAAGRGEPALVGATFKAPPPARRRRCAAPRHSRDGAGDPLRQLRRVQLGVPDLPRGGHRLPQMLTHIGEGLHGGRQIGVTGSTLLDCACAAATAKRSVRPAFRTSPLYETMQAASDKERHRDRERHVALLSLLRASPRYAREFLDIRPGGYTSARRHRCRRAAIRPAARRERRRPAATCIHCGGCVNVCPTSANQEYEGLDPRWITTDQARCIGCGTCVEVCPANLRQRRPDAARDGSADPGLVHGAAGDRGGRMSIDIERLGPQLDPDGGGTANGALFRERLALWERPLTCWWIPRARAWTSGRARAPRAVASAPARRNR